MVMAELNKIPAIMKQIKDESSRMILHDGYIGDNNLIYLTDKQAEIALYLDVPMGVRDKYEEAGGNHMGDYCYHMPQTMESLRDRLQYQHSEGKASIYPYLPDPMKMFEYIKDIEDMDISMDALKAVGGYGREQLMRLTNTIGPKTGGKQELAIDFTGGVYIKQDESANTGLDMRKKIDFETGVCRLEFQGYLRRMGVNMPAAGMRAIADEASQLADFIEELESNPIAVTEENIQQWAKEIAAMQVDRAIAESKHELEAATQQEPEIIM